MQANSVAVGIVLAAAVTTALGVLWKKVVRPAALAVHEAGEILPIVREIVDTWAGAGHVPAILAEIAAQFRTDHGSTLRDIVNRLETAATANQVATDALVMGAAVSKEIAELDRTQVMRLATLLDRLTVSVISGNEGVARIEVDRAASQQRADQMLQGDPGAAADAAAQSEHLKES